MSKKKNVWIDIMMLPLCFITAYPFLFIVITAFKSQRDVALNPYWFTSTPTLVSFQKAFSDSPILQLLCNNVYITVVSVLGLILISSMAAYAVTYHKTKFTRSVFFYLLIGFFIPFQATLLPLYTMFQTLHLMNTLIGLILLYMSGLSLAFFMFCGYMKGLPEELIQASRIDGCGAGRAFWQIILPLCKPISITVTIFTAFSNWNNYLAPSLFITSREKGTLILEVTRAAQLKTTDWGRMFAVVVVTLLPLAIFFLCVQRYLVQGITEGSVKG